MAKMMSHRLPIFCLKNLVPECMCFKSISIINLSPRVLFCFLCRKDVKKNKVVKAVAEKCSL